MNYLYCDAVASDPTIAIELYAAADMFVLERLKLKCSDMIGQQLNIENSCTCLLLLLLFSRYSQLLLVNIDFVLTFVEK
jgi:hypothetical protein